MISDPAIATAADYADALLTARRAKNILLLIVLLTLLAQLAIFFSVKYSGIVFPLDSVSIATTAPANAARWQDFMHYVIGVSDFAGIALSIVLTMVLYLIVKIMLVGRLIGVARVTGALIWSVVIVVLLFPWQAFLAYSTFNSRNFMIPGVLYTWEELLSHVTLGTRGMNAANSSELILHWTRFVAWPVIAIIVLLIIQVKSNRGMRQALGEDALIEDSSLPPTV